MPNINRSRLKKILFAGILLLLAGSAIYWYIATDKFADTADRKPAYIVEALPFIREFTTDEKTANQKYTEKIIVVTGTVSATEKADSTINVKMIDPGGSYIIFAFQDQHLEDAKSIKEGDHVSIKGSCSGSVYSDILETHVISFKRSALNNK